MSSHHKISFEFSSMDKGNYDQFFLMSLAVINPWYHLPTHIIIYGNIVCLHPSKCSIAQYANIHLSNALSRVQSNTFFTELRSHKYLGAWKYVL